jgi:hypothetical protein
MTTKSDGDDVSELAKGGPIVSLANEALRIFFQRRQLRLEGHGIETAPSPL